MNLKEEQAKEYLNEAKLTLDAAKAILESANKSKKELWAQVIKNSYDATEQALSAAIANQSEVIPKEHPEKVKSFLLLTKPPKEIEKILYFWLRKRAKAQYIDISDGKISIPHKLFTQADASMAIRDCEKIIFHVAGLLNNSNSPSD